MPGNQAASLSRPRRGPNMDCISSPKNCLKMLENQAMSLQQLGRVLDVACTSWPKTSRKCLKTREFVVGCENNLWAVPSSVDEFNKWAKKTHFQIGDSLVLKYNSKTHSVLEVNEEGYKISNNANLIKSHNDRETTISLEKSCLFFFISGAEEHCQKGQRLEVMVLSEKNGFGHQSTAKEPSSQHHLTTTMHRR
ncbi:early nodulin-like protein 1 [Olea europaea var. sylvestris]|uniref:early nodulin-like protein 1 n=1 Tax=Olea europaea var. sylvestris TaxID=158386 RepID=UPI000C1CED16|nr:early nodulin-like protein 1 [Olea europaea var. sylvestris]